MWRREQWNTPSRTDQYVMQLTAEVANVPQRMFGGKGARLSTIKDWALTFVFGTRRRKGKTDVLGTPDADGGKVRQAQSRWFALVRKKPRPPPPGG